MQALSPIWILLGSMFLGRDQMSKLTSFLVDPCSWSHHKQVPHLDNRSLQFLNISRFSMSQCSKKGPISARYFTKKQVSTTSAILADVTEHRKIEIYKTIDTKLSEDITITHCYTEVWIKTISWKTWMTCWSNAPRHFVICIMIAMLATTKTNMPCYKSDGVNGLASHLYVGQRKTMPWYQIQWAAEPIQQAMDLNLHMSVV